MTDIALLKLFLAIAEEGSIAAGARRFDLAPSIASRKLAKLERQFQVKLMQRSTRALTLTNSGRMFQERARAIVDRFDQMVDQLAFERGALTGHVKIAINDVMGQTLLPAALSHFRKHHSGLTFSITLSDEPLGLLRNNCDLAIHAGSSPGSNLIGRRIYSYKRVICATPGYLARKGVPKSPEELERHECIVHSQNDRSTWHFQSPEGGRVAQTIDPVIQTNSYRSLINLARQDLGLIRIGRALVESQLASGEFQAVLTDYECTEADGTYPTIWLTYPDRVLLSRVRMVADQMYAIMRNTVARPDWWTAVMNEVTE